MSTDGIAEELLKIAKDLSGESREGAATPAKVKTLVSQMNDRLKNIVHDAPGIKDKSALMKFLQDLHKTDKALLKIEMAMDEEIMVNP